ncbi:MAG: carboxymuconolactone decarboxylase family protein [Hyphomicrobiales bacterium]|uniref:carboxymuconolactone decarboxylase family protein n=1 Tax=Rhabdaerophilum calidifontis TaxID=2604328 RepID=UPI00123B571F|nr:carboxymuconolactone decarboxylase family protein [Rhabdaerophilum calidifontis]MCA1951651.1 carboxymuconolactone decarboxylase family protein [Hyphomicrobiales bacterium]
MPKINPVTHPEGAAKTILDGVRAKIGMVPNLYATLAHAPAVLGAHLAFTQALAEGGTLGAKDRERIALAVGEANACQYCLSAHTLIGKGAGLSAEEIAAARSGQPAEPRDAAIVALARAIVAKKGYAGSEDLAAARAAGLSDGVIVEILAQVTVNLFTNYANHLFDTTIDFPAVAPAKAA